MSTINYISLLKVSLRVEDCLKRLPTELHQLKRLHMDAIIKPIAEKLNAVIDFSLLIRSLKLPPLESKWRRLFYLALSGTTEEEYDICLREMGKMISFLEQLHSHHNHQ